MGQWLKKRNIPYLLDVKDQWPNIIVESVPKSIRLFARILLESVLLYCKENYEKCHWYLCSYISFCQLVFSFSNKEKSNADIVAPLSAPSDAISTGEMAGALIGGPIGPLRKLARFGLFLLAISLRKLLILKQFFLLRLS